MAGDITPIHLKKVADRIGNEWMTLGVQLGVPYYKLQTMSSPALGGPTQYGARMMNHWYAKNARLPPEQVRQTFMAALKEAGRMDLARDVKNSRMNNDADIQRVFHDISPCLTKEWRDVGINLEMTFSELDAIKAPQPLENDPRKEMLEMWYKDNLENRREQLTAALEHMKRQDIVSEIGGPVSTPSDSAPVSMDTNDFFQQPLPSVPTSQPGSMREPQGPTAGGAQPGADHMLNAQAQSLPSDHSVMASPSGAPPTHNIQTSCQSYQQSGSVETSLQQQQAQVVPNRVPNLPPPDLTSVQTDSLTQQHSVDGRQDGHIIVQPTDANTVQSLDPYHDPSI